MTPDSEQHEEERQHADPRETLARRRAEVQLIDQRVLELLAERLRLGREIGALKREAGLPVLDPTREAEVIRAVVATARTLGLPGEPIREIYWRIIALARGMQVDDA